jgi:hypothetical protein
MFTLAFFAENIIIYGGMVEVNSVKAILKTNTAKPPTKEEIKM